MRGSGMSSGINRRPSKSVISSDSAKLLEEIFRETGFTSYASDSNLARLKHELDEHNKTVSGVGYNNRREKR